MTAFCSKISHKFCLQISEFRSTCLKTAKHCGLLFPDPGFCRELADRAKKKKKTQKRHKKRKRRKKQFPHILLQRSHWQAITKPPLNFQRIFIYPHTEPKKRPRTPWRLLTIAYFQRSGPNPDVSFSLIILCQCIGHKTRLPWRETPVRIDHHPTRDNNMPCTVEGLTLETSANTLFTAFCISTSTLRWYIVQKNKRCWRNCLQCTSYMKLYNLLFSISVRSRSILKDYNWFCRFSFDRHNWFSGDYRIRSNPKKQKREKGGARNSIIDITFSVTWERHACI